MKKLHFILVFSSLICNNIFAAVPVGTNISRYPNTNVAPDMGMLLVAVTNDPGAFPRTNYNILVTDFINQITNGLATTSFVLASSNNVFGIITVTSNSLFTTTTTVSNGVISQIINLSNNILTVIPANLWTNSGGFLRPTTNTSVVSISSTGLLGNLVVTQDIRFLGHNSATNYIWVCTNGTTGEGEWRDISTLLSPVGINPRTNLFNIQYEPVRGSTWYSGTNGIPTTNEARAGFEYNPQRRSLRVGEVSGGPHPNNMMGDGSNAWNNTNLMTCSVGLGSNGLVQAAYSSVLGGIWNGIRSNATAAVIGGGVNNQIDTNAVAGVIGGGGLNWIRTPGLIASTANNVTIAGGSNNIIGGTSIDIHGSTIGGGGDNVIEGGQHSVIASGFGNQLQEGSDFATIGGGFNNHILENGASSGGGNYSTISGGRSHSIRGSHSFIGGGFENGMFGNASGIGANFNVICGGASNNIGVNNFPSLFCVIGGGHECDIQNDASYSVVTGGRQNNIGGNENTNCVISGGFNNTISANVPAATIGGGRQNIITSSGDYGTILAGTSNTVSAPYATVVGNFGTNNTAGSTLVTELVSYNTLTTIAGTGNGNTNYTLNVNTPEMILGGSNVNILAAMGWIDGKVHKFSLSITNLSTTSTENWGFGFQSTSNRVKWFSSMYGTNQPAILTNNTILRIDFTTFGTNILAEYKYFRPAL